MHFNVERNPIVNNTTNTMTGITTATTLSVGFSGCSTSKSHSIPEMEPNFAGAGTK